MTFDLGGRSPSLQVLSLRSKFPMDFMICTSHSTMHCPLMVQPNKAGNGGNIEVPSIISAPFKKYDMKNCLYIYIYTHTHTYIYTKFLYNSHLKVAMALKEVEHTEAFGDDAVPCTDCSASYVKPYMTKLHARLHTCTHTNTHTHTLSLSLSLQV